MILDPVFIIASPRSGSSMLRLMLTCHRALHLPPECGFALWLRTDYGTWTEANLETDLDRFLDALFPTRKFETWSLERPALREWLLREARPRTYAELVSSIYTFHGLAHHKQAFRWGDKNNYYLDHIGELHELFPRAVFLHLVRDVRDIACSYLELAGRRFASPYAPRLAQDVESIARSWQEDLERIRGSLESLDAQAALELRFEDLAARPEETLRQICAFLGLPFDPAMLGFYERNREHGLEPAATMEWKQKTLEPVDPSRVGRYRAELSPQQVRTVEAVAQDGLRRYGYLD